MTKACGSPRVICTAFLFKYIIRGLKTDLSDRISPNDKHFKEVINTCRKLVQQLRSTEIK